MHGWRPEIYPVFLPFPPNFTMVPTQPTQDISEQTKRGIENAASKKAEKTNYGISR